MLGRNGVSIDRIDSWGEVTLGLSCTCCISMLIAAVVLPFIEIGGTAWVKTWEGAGHSLDNETELVNSTTAAPGANTTAAPGGQPGLQINEKALTAEELQHYIGTQATVSGQFTFYLSLPSTPPPPANADIKDALEPILEHALSDFFTTTMHWGHFSVLDEQGSAPETTLGEHRTIVGTFEITSQDGGTLQKDLQDKSTELETDMSTGIAEASLSWYEGGTFNFYCELDASYFGNDDLPLGASLSQRSGEDHNPDGEIKAYSGSAPYVATEARTK
mmetsp:Transcript_10465/g.18888  ORF Transcript_10465/g.18888 Transcript_10465/m.18888 type:complete len:275 (-) Transcript_10465:146-970(-)